MPVYRIADVYVKINPVFEKVEERLLPYLSDESKFDFEICISKDEIVKRSKSSDNPCSLHEAESLLILTKLCYKILEDYNGFFFHSSSLMLDGEGYVFTAPSGTGKSTHTSIWRKHFGNRITIINDDKPIIRKINGSFRIYGTPWMGKSDLGCNISSPVKAVYVLKRGDNNKAVRVKAGEVFKELLEATVVPSERELMIKLLCLYDEFFRQTPLFLITCNMNEDAAETAYRAAQEI